MSSIDWAMVSALVAIITLILPSPRGTGAKLARAIGYCVRKTLLWFVHIVVTYAVVVYNGVSKRLIVTKEILALRWTIWRKRVRLNIDRVIAQDKGLQEKSATDNERIGMAAIMLAELLVVSHVCNRRDRGGGVWSWRPGC